MNQLVIEGRTGELKERLELIAAIISAQKA
jgi:hypothetical protein